MRIKIRRLTDAARQLLTGANAPAEGELVYATDTKLVYIGDGSTAGGNLLNPAKQGNLQGQIANPTTGALTAAHIGMLTTVDSTVRNTVQLPSGMPNSTFHVTGGNGGGAYLVQPPTGGFIATGSTTAGVNVPIGLNMGESATFWTANGTHYGILNRSGTPLSGQVTNGGSANIAANVGHVLASVTIPTNGTYSIAGYAGFLGSAITNVGFYFNLNGNSLERIGYASSPTAFGNFEANGALIEALSAGDVISIVGIWSGSGSTNLLDAKLTFVRL